MKVVAGLLPALLTASLTAPLCAQTGAPVRLKLDHEAAASTTLGGRQVSGLVLGPDGAPEAGALVMGPSGSLVVSDASGAFELTLAEQGPEPQVLRAYGAQQANQFGQVQVSSLGALGGVPVTIQMSAGSCQPDWLPMFGGSTPAPKGQVRSMLAFDDGTGPALYVGGISLTIDDPGLHPFTNLARWNGVQWSNLGGQGPNSVVNSLAAGDDGSGPALYAGGQFVGSSGLPTLNIARFQNGVWSSLGTGCNGPVLEVEFADLGSGPQLFVGGLMTSAGGVPVNRVARWDGQAWSGLGSGVSGTTSPRVTELMAFNFGAGPRLVVGGRFTNAGGVSATNIATWDGNTWAAMGAGLSMPGPNPGTILALAAFDSGAGVQLHVGGQFSQSGTQSMRGFCRWNGTAFQELGGGISGPQTSSPVPYVTDLTLGQFQGQPALYVCGDFTAVGGQPTGQSAVWRASGWTLLGPTLVNPNSTLSAERILEVDLGAGPEVFVAGGAFAGPYNFARLKSQLWGYLDTSVNGPVRTLCVHDDGSGVELYAGGSFSTIEGSIAPGVLRFDGVRAEPVGNGINGPVTVLREAHVAGVKRLVAGGYFFDAGGTAASCIAYWDGLAWNPFGAGFDGEVRALAEYDDGTGLALYAGGGFNFSGLTPMGTLARWTGSQWVPVGGGLLAGVYALKVYDDGSGERLHVGMNGPVFSNPNIRHYCTWDGSNWGGLPENPNWYVTSIEAFDDGSGSALYLGGVFKTIGTTQTGPLVRWDGSQISVPGAGTVGQPALSAINTMRVVDPGTGPALFVGATFNNSGGSPVQKIVAWNGTVWTSPATISGAVQAFEEFDDGVVRSLFVGGPLEILTTGDIHLARLALCPTTGFLDLPGCAGNPAQLSTAATAIQLGGTLAMDLSAAQPLVGAALLYANSPGIDGSGCGLLLPGLGEILLSLAPAPLELAVLPTANGQASFVLPVPNNQLLLGQSLAFQGAVVGNGGQGLQVELSQALLGTFQ